MERPELTLDLPLSEAGRILLAKELDIFRLHLPALQSTAEVTAVHEARKAIRRTFTLVKQLAPYYAPGALERYRRGLRRIMRRLAPCRDLAIFRLNLATYRESAQQPLAKLDDYTRRQLTAANDNLRVYLARPKVNRFLARYDDFVGAPGAGLPPDSSVRAPLLVRHALSGLILQRLGVVRAYGAILDTATPAQLHQLRIQFKELRYTLAFFEPVLGEGITPFIDRLHAMQDHLGLLNDAAVAQDLLNEMDCCPGEVALYRRYQAGVATQLTAEFVPLFAEMDQYEVRRALALTLAGL